MKQKLNRLFTGAALTMLPFLVLPAGAQSPTLGVTNDNWPLAFSGPWPTPDFPPVDAKPGHTCRLAVARALRAPSLSEMETICWLPLLRSRPQRLRGSSAARFQCRRRPRPPCPWSPITAAPVNTTDAELNGTILPNTFDTTYWYQWGTSITYGQTTQSGVVSGSNTTPVSVSVGIWPAAERPSFQTPPSSRYGAPARW